jgi:hypothetical protein
MAMLSGIDEAGVESLYDIPDEVLEKYRLQSKPLTDEDKASLFPGKDELTKDDAQGAIPLHGGDGDADVEGQAVIVYQRCTCWRTVNGWTYYWPCWC